MLPACPLCLSPATLASLGTKIRACGTRRHLVLAGSVPGGFRVRLGVWLGGEEEGKEDGLRMVRSQGGRSLAEDREGSV